MNLNDIDYLVAVAEHRHVGRAAETLGLTQSALTRALARLESLAGLPLFERHPKGVIPTEAGLAFLRRARRIQLEYDDTLSELHQMKTGELGILRIGYSPSTDVERLMGVVRRLLLERPAARLHLSERLMHYLLADLDACRAGAAARAGSRCPRHPANRACAADARHRPSPAVRHRTAARPPTARASAAAAGRPPHPPHPRPGPPAGNASAVRSDGGVRRAAPAIAGAPRP